MDGLFPTANSVDIASVSVKRLLLEGLGRKRLALECWLDRGIPGHPA